MTKKHLSKKVKKTIRNRKTNRKTKKIVKKQRGGDNSNLSGSYGFSESNLRKHRENLKSKKKRSSESISVSESESDINPYFNRTAQSNYILCMGKNGKQIFVNPYKVKSKKRCINYDKKWDFFWGFPNENKT